MFINAQVYDDIYKLIILYPIDLRILFSIYSISLLQPGVEMIMVGVLSFYIPRECLQA